MVVGRFAAWQGVIRRPLVCVVVLSAFVWVGGERCWGWGGALYASSFTGFGLLSSKRGGPNPPKTQKAQRRQYGFDYKKKYNGSGREGFDVSFLMINRFLDLLLTIKICGLQEVNHEKEYPSNVLQNMTRAHNSTYKSPLVKLRERGRSKAK